jgi:hypothetical protein
LKSALTTLRRRWKLLFFLLGGLPALVGVGCHLLQTLGLSSSRPSFSHARHVLEKKMACEDCHADYETSDKAGMPILETCQPCHEGKDAQKPVGKRVQDFVRDGQPVWSQATKLSDEVVFSHQLHHQKGVACGECHHGIEKSTAVGSRLALSMQDCMDCHARKTASNDCATCHKVIRKELPPQSHRLSWLQLHGQSVRGGRQERALCSLCHADSQCAGCHRETPPANHTNFWRQRGHGVAVRIDRDTCRTCHTVDYCDRCHREVQPRSHLASFGAPLDRHCLTCHSPLRSEQCFVCHKSTPDHLLAAPKPSWHTPAMNCRQCHGAGQPLPHVDNGDNCNGCHR